MIQNKEAIKVYYQTHNESIKDVAKLFNCSYRTLAHWIQVEGWKKGEAIENIKEPLIQNRLLKKEYGTVLYKETENLKESIKRNLGDSVHLLDEMILNNILEDSTNKLLLGAMSLDSITKNIALSAVIAKNELLKMIEIEKDNPNYNANVILAAEKVQKIFIDLKESIYGKEAIRNEEDKPLSCENLSIEELELALRELEKEEK